MKIYALIWQQDLAKIGVTLNVNEVENARFYDIGLAGDLLGFGIHPWVSGRSTRDPAVFMGTQLNYRGDPELNRYGHVNPELEELVAAGAVEPDEEKRQQIYWEINQMLLDDLPTINVMTYPRTWVWHKDVKDIEIDLLGNIVLQNTWIDRP
jgi:ABC-type transport system substrate-binding protein